MDPRRDMLDEIRADYARTSRQTGRRAPDPRVLAAIAALPREDFVLEPDLTVAYANTPRPIGFGQTISQPFIVALMTDLLDVQPSHKVLDVGTGSGYQAAVLAQLCRCVYGVERHGVLVVEARRRLQALGVGEFHLRHGDGWLGWQEHAPYDRIVVAAAAPDVSPAWLEQLAPGGRIVVPLGRVTGGNDTQTLTVVDKDAAGATTKRAILAVRFVPLTHGA